MNRGFYSLPDPREVGLRWRHFEAAREKIRCVEERHREAGRKARELEERIRAEQNADVRELAQAILAGEDAPAAPTEKLEGLAADLRQQRRRMEALEQALPQAEEGLRQVVYENQHRWMAEADGALEKAIAEERKAYDKALKLIEEPRLRRIYAETLSQWVRSVEPVFGTPSDVAARSAIQNLASGAYVAEEKMRERTRTEQLQEQQEVIS